jgi:predicted amidohydrolase YtcJ
MSLSSITEFEIPEFRIPEFKIKLVLSLLAFTFASQAPAQEADIIFIGQHIITVDEKSPGAEAVAVKDGRILAIGDRVSMLGLKSEQTRVVELGERALLPGFIDAHGHVGMQSKLLRLANLSPPPVGTVTNIEEVTETLRTYIRQAEIPAGQWVVGFGYDDSLLAERRHPNRDELDAVSAEHPVFILHTSGHLGAVNSMALAAVGISAESQDPPGGVIRRRPGSNEPDGVLEESAMWQAYMALPKPSLETSVQQIVDVQSYYASKGITTVQEGGASPEDIKVLSAAASQQKLILDIVAYSLWLPEQGEIPSPGKFGEYRNRFKVGGIKLMLDGSPQGKTAYLSEPYEVSPPGHDRDYVGYPASPSEVVDQAVHEVLSGNIHVLAHANGDAAAEMLINAVEKATDSLQVQDTRVVMIHAQSVRDDQLDRMAMLGMVPSFFSAHTFFWGDWHRDSVFGPRRADRISPTRSALERGIVFTVHNDAPVTPPIPIDLLWSTVNRRTRSGDILGPLQRIDTYEAIRALTINGAYQYFEEDHKGSITPGKLADLVVLSQNPLTTEAAMIQDISVVETFSHGRSVFKAGSD